MHACILTVTDREAVFKILKSPLAPTKFVEISSCIRVNGQLSSNFEIKSGMRQGHILAPCIFNTVIHYVMGRISTQGVCGASYGKSTWQTWIILMLLLSYQKPWKCPSSHVYYGWGDNHQWVDDYLRELLSPEPGWFPATPRCHLYWW